MITMMVSSPYTLHGLRSLSNITYDSAMNNGTNPLTGNSYKDEGNATSSTTTSNNTLPGNVVLNSAYSDSKAAQLEAIWIMQQYLQSSLPSSSVIRNGSQSMSLEHSTTNIPLARVPDLPIQHHTVDTTIFATSEVIKQKLLSEKEDDDDHLLNQILFASDNQTITSSIADGNEITERQSQPGNLQHQSGHVAIVNDSSDQNIDESNIFNSMKWHPTYETTHQDIVYNENLFATEAVGLTTVATQSLEQSIHPSATVAWSGAAALLNEPHGSCRGIVQLPATTGTEALLYAAELTGVPPTVAPSKSSNTGNHVTSKMKARSNKSSKNGDKRDEENVTASDQKSSVAVDITVIPYYEITDNDVLLGRGGRTNHHAGNKKYLEYKVSLQEQYFHADKDEKTSLSQQLVQMVYDRKGRFLKLADTKLLEQTTCDVESYGECQLWYEVDVAVARRKASQTLRELNTPEIRAAKRAKYSK